jgi:hypothetical protein
MAWGKGFEHLVEHHPSDVSRVVKFPHNDNDVQHGFKVEPVTMADPDSGRMVESAAVQAASPSEYLDRLADHNKAFHDDVRLIGASKRPDETWVLVTSQPKLSGDTPGFDEMEGYMRGNGFSKMLDHGATSIL